MDGLPYPAQGNIIDAEELKSQGEGWNLLQIVLSTDIVSTGGNRTRRRMGLRKAL